MDVTTVAELVGGGGAAVVDGGGGTDVDGGGATAVVCRMVCPALTYAVHLRSVQQLSRASPSNFTQMFPASQYPMPSPQH
jgi:hypothetical protein